MSSEIKDHVRKALIRADADTEGTPDYDVLAGAAIEAVRQHFINAANDCKFSSDRHAMFCAVEELEDALKLR